MSATADLSHLGLTGTASLAEELDSTRLRRTRRAPRVHFRPHSVRVRATAAKTMVQLRDGRKIIGVMRSFDQFANIVLEEAVERIIVDQRYADVPLGLYVIRGENVVLIGQIVRAATPQPHLTASVDLPRPWCRHGGVVRPPGWSVHGRLCTCVARVLGS
jgi:small nuclear ribonucleoprotein (snRNP)-like protein